MLETNNEQEQVEKDVEMKEENIEVEKDNSKISFKDTFSAAIVDLAVTAAGSVVGLFLIDAILRVTAGFYIKEKVSFSVIIFVIVSLLYTSIMESSKGETIGKRLLKLKITRA